jgi:CheY-like chemotaxis protein
MTVAGQTGRPARRVLVVDDNQPSAQSLAWVMEANGYEVKACFDGKSAVQAAHDFHPDVVLLDLGMPVMDGYEVCRRLREDRTLADTLVIAQTGWGGEAERRRTAAVGFNHHMTKPLDFTVLLALIDRTLH